VGVQNFILVLQNCTNKSAKYSQGLVLLFKNGVAGDTDLGSVGA
jgi:hypothetical protein